MPKRLFMYKGERPSEGFQNLRAKLGELSSGNGPTILRPLGSALTDGRNKVILNWGSTSEEMYRLEGRLSQGEVLNRPDSVGRAIDKLLTLLRLHEEDIGHVGFFQRASDAVNHVVTTGCRVYARTKLRGHSGEGIVIMMRDDDPQWARIRETENYLGYSILVYDNQGRTVANSPDSHTGLARCPLFTIGTIGRRSEYRVHVFKGQVILSQTKRRRSGFTEGNSLIRNKANGWVYTISGEPEVPQIVKTLALQAVASLGLDFGAVDIVTSGPEYCKVLEVNTAPGIDDESTTLERYAQAIHNYIHADD